MRIDYAGKRLRVGLRTNELGARYYVSRFDTNKRVWLIRSEGGALSSLTAKELEDGITEGIVHVEAGG